MLSPYYARLRSEIERFGGTVEKFIGDAVMAVFGAPVAHEDDPERAVRAALADPRRCPGAERSRPDARPARPHRGQHGRGARRARRATRPRARGWSPATSSTRPPACRRPRPWTAILVGEATYRATERVDRVQRERAGRAKGKAEPVPVWEAVGRPRASRRRRRSSAARRRWSVASEELDLLTDALARARRAERRSSSRSSASRESARAGSSGSSRRRVDDDPT